jgi:hypothetical protein
LSHELSGRNLTMLKAAKKVLEAEEPCPLFYKREENRD